ncbi:MAG: DUF3352 domain-containing protein, partial [Gaiellales bacterium]
MLRRSFSRPRTFAAIAACGLLAAGCGGSSGGGSAGAAGTDGLGAQAAPASSIAFFDVNIDRSSNSWKQMLALGARFPSWPKLIAQIQTSVNKVGSDGTSFSGDIEPWLGGELSVAVTGVTVGGASGGGSAQFVAFVQSTDDTKLEAALTKGGNTVPGAGYNGYDTFTSKDGGMFAAVHDGALLISNSQTALDQSIDARSGKADELANAQTYKDAIAALPKDNIAVGYVDGAQLASLAQLATAQASSSGVQAGGISPTSLDSLTTELKGIRAISFSVTPEDQGIRFRSATLLASDAPASMTSQTQYTPTLLANVPAGSYVAADFSDLGKSLSQELASVGGSQAKLTQAFSALQTETGISFPDDIVPLLSGEDAIAVGPGLPVSASLLLHPADATAGEASLRKITAALTKLAGTQFAEANGGQTTSLSGITAGWRRAGDLLAISNDPTAGNAVSSPLSDDPSFKAFEQTVGVPDQVTGLLYVDVGRVLGLAKTFMGSASASDQEALDNAGHVGRVLAYGSKNGGTATADLFVEIT